MGQGHQGEKCKNFSLEPSIRISWFKVKFMRVKVMRVKVTGSMSKLLSYLVVPFRDQWNLTLLQKAGDIFFCDFIIDGQQVTSVVKLKRMDRRMKWMDE